LSERDEDGATALDIACHRGHAPVVKLLMIRGADPTTVDDEGYVPLQSASYSGHVQVVRFLLECPSAKATINHQNEYGHTALLSACYWGREGAVRALLESGADPTVADEHGRTPMSTAKEDRLPVHTAAEGRRECVAALEVSCSFGSPSCSTGVCEGRHFSLHRGGRGRSKRICFERPGKWRRRLRASRRRRW
jgi:hypothetical protein